MKRLLLLFLLSPVVLFSQTRRQQSIDSIKAAASTNLKGIPALLGSTPGTRLENLSVLDSGEYVTIITRFHVVNADAIKATPPKPVIILKTDSVTDSLTTANIPQLPPFIEEVRLIPTPNVILKTDSVTDGLTTANVPQLPPFIEEVHLISTPIVILKTDIVTGSLTAANIPPLPPFIEEVPLIPTPIVILKTDSVADLVSAITIPPLPPIIIEVDTMLAVSPIALLKTRIPAGKMDTVVVPDLEEKKYPVAGMHFSDEGYSLLEKLEGFSPELYSLKDGGYTIGFGFFVPYSEGTKWEKGVTWEEAEKIIRQKMPQYEDQVKKFINVPLTQNQFDALIMLAYNLGGFSKATSIVNDINSQADFDQLRNDWNRFVHSKAPGVTKGLINRRRDEIGVRNDADYQPKRKVNIFKTRKQ